MEALILVELLLKLVLLQHKNVLAEFTSFQAQKSIQVLKKINAHQFYLLEVGSFKPRTSWL